MTQQDSQRTPSNSRPGLRSPQIVAAIIGLIGTLAASYFAYLQITEPTRIAISATQTAEARILTLTALANSTLTPTSTLTPKPTLTSTPEPTPTSTLIPTLTPLPILTPQDDKPSDRVAVDELPAGWTQEVVYETDLVEPWSIYADGSGGVLVLDSLRKAVYRLDAAGVLDDYADYDGITLFAIAWQPNTERLIGLGPDGLLAMGTDGFRPLADLGPDRLGSTMIVNPTDDSIFVGEFRDHTPIFHYNAQGHYLQTVVRDNRGCSQMAVSSDGKTLYYTETYEGRISKLDTETLEATVLTEGLAIPGTEEAIGIALDDRDRLYAYTAKEGLLAYREGGFVPAAPPAGGMGPIVWYAGSDMFVGTGSVCGCLTRFDPVRAESGMLTEHINTGNLVETPEGNVVICSEDQLYRVERSGLTPFGTVLPDTCASLTVDQDGILYTSFAGGEESLIVSVDKEGRQETWPRVKGFLSMMRYDPLHHALVVLLENRFLIRIPIDQPGKQEVLLTLEEGDEVTYTLDDEGNVYLFERKANSLSVLKDGTTTPKVLFSDVIKRAEIGTPPVLYVSHINGLLIGRNDDFEMWPLDGGDPYIFAVNAAGVDNFGMFETEGHELLCSHAGQIFRMIPPAGASE